MALTSRDVMFIMRSQDYASRGVMGLVRNFNRLHQEMQKIDDTLQNKLNKSFARQAQMVARSQDHVRRSVEPLRQHNDQLSSQNARLQQMAGTIRRTGAARETMIQGLEKERSLVNKTIESNRKQINSLRNRASQVQRVNAVQATAFRQQADGLARENTSLGNVAGQYTRYINRITDAGVSRKAALAHIDKLVQANRVEAVQNRETANQVTRQGATVQREIKRRQEARRQEAHQNAALAREQLQRQQALIQRTMSAGVALTLMGGIMVATGGRVLSSFRDMTIGAADFQRELALASTQADRLGATVGELRNIAYDVGSTVPAALEDIPQTLFFIFSSTNANIIESRELLRGFAQEAVAGNTNIQAAARSTIAIMNAMAMDTSELTRIQDVQFQTVRRGVITYEELSKNIGKMLPAVRRSGQEIETAGAMLAFLTRQGLSAEMASTAAARSLELIADPRVVRRMEDMGMQVRDATGEFNPLVDILGEMNDQFGHLTAPERSAALLEIFGGAGYRIQARRFFDTVFGNFDQFRQHIEWQLEASGAMKDAYDIMFGQPTEQIKLLQNNVQILRNEIGEAFIPILSDLVNIAQEVVAWFRGIDSELRSGMIQWIGIAGLIVTVVGAFAMMAGIMTSIIALAAPLVHGLGAAFSIFIGWPALIIAVASGLAALVLVFDDTNSAIEMIASWLGISEGLLQTFIVTLGIASVALGAIKVKALIASGAIGTLSAALWKLAAAHPIMLAITAAVVALGAAIYIFGQRQREVNRLSKDFADGMSDSIHAVIESEESLRDYSNTMRDAQRETAEQVLREKDLYNVMLDNNINTNDMLDGIVNLNGARKEQLKIIDEEIAKSQESEGYWANYVNRMDDILGFSLGIETNTIKLRELSEVYGVLAEAADLAFERQLSQWKDEGGINAMVAEYIQLMQHGSGSSVAMAKSLEEQIVQLILMRDGYENIDPALRDVIHGMEGGEAAMEAARETMEQQREDLELLSDSWGMLSDIVGGSIDIYREKLQDLNSDIENEADKHAASLELYQEAMHETKDELDWALQAQTELRNKYGDEVVAWWAEMYRQEPELAKEIHEVLLEGDLEFYNQQRELRASQAEFILRDLDAYGIDIVDTHGRISRQAIQILSQEMGVHPAVVEAILMESETVVEARLKAINDLSEDELATFVENATTAGADSVAGLSRELGVGVGVIQGIVNDYNIALADGLNPIMRSLGQQTIRIRNLSQGVRSGLNAGGLVPGTGPDRDTVPAMLTPGEFVLQRGAVRNLDLHSLHLLNDTGDPRSLAGFNTGGFVTPEDVPTPPAGYHPPIKPITAPAHAVDTEKYNQATAFVKKYGAPPLDSGIGWKAMWQAVSNRFPRVALHSAYRPGAITATGNPSYHGMGRAIDISPRRDIADWLRQNYMSQTRELIFSPMNNQQVHNGRNHMYSGITRAMHWDHIHWAMANGGVIGEPVFGMGLRSGNTYSFGERGPETVTPGIGEALSFSDFGMPGRSLSSVTGDDRQRIREEIKDNKELIRVQRMSFEQHAEHLTKKMANEVKYSNEWKSLMDERRQVIESSIAHQIEIEDNLFQLQRISADEYIAILDSRIASEKRFTNEWMQLSRRRQDIIDEEVTRTWDLVKSSIQAHQQLISSQQRLTDLQNEFEQMQRGPTAAQELELLRAQRRVQELRETVSGGIEGLMSSGPQSPEQAEQIKAQLADAEANLQAAKTNLAYAEFDQARISNMIEAREDLTELDALLLKFQGEKQMEIATRELSEAQQVLSETTKEQADAIAGGGLSAKDAAYQLQVAELELKIALEDVERMKQGLIPTTEELKLKELELVLAEMEHVEAGRRVAEISELLAQNYITEAEQAGGLIDVLRNLIKTYSDLAAVQVGTTGIGVVKAHTGKDREAVLNQQKTADRIRQIFENRNVDISTSTQTEAERIARITQEVLSGERTLDDVRESVDWISRNFDTGGMLRPGLTFARNQTGQNEFILTPKQFDNLTSQPTKNITIEEGAVKLEFNGPIDSASIDDVQDYIDRTFEELVDRLRSD